VYVLPSRPLSRPACWQTQMSPREAAGRAASTVYVCILIIFICMYVCVCVYAFMCVSVCARACVRACVRACRRACVRACVPACARACVRACVLRGVRERARARVRASVRYTPAPLRPARAVSRTLCRCGIAGIGVLLGVIRHLFCYGLLRLLHPLTPRRSARVHARARAQPGHTHPREQKVRSRAWHVGSPWQRPSRQGLALLCSQQASSPSPGLPRRSRGSYADFGIFGGPDPEIGFRPLAI
jgi:hypothetical protein